jgi:hypothetical protein
MTSESNLESGRKSSHSNKDTIIVDEHLTQLPLDFEDYNNTVPIPTNSPKKKRNEYSPKKKPRNSVSISQDHQEKSSNIFQRSLLSNHLLEKISIINSLEDSSDDIPYSSISTESSSFPVDWTPTISSPKSLTPSPPNSPNTSATTIGSINSPEFIGKVPSNDTSVTRSSSVTPIAKDPPEIWYVDSNTSSDGDFGDVKIGTSRDYVSWDPIARIKKKKNVRLDFQYCLFWVI